MTLIRRILGIIVILTALFGVALSVGCTLYGEASIDTAGRQTISTIELARGSIDTTTAALRLAQDTLESVNGTLDTVADTAVTLSKTVSETNPLLEEINDITTSRVPDSLAAVEQTLPNIAEVAGTIDNTLIALSSFGFRQNFFGLGTIDFDLGIDYDPEVRFDESIATLEESLAGLPEQLRTLEPQLELAQENLGSISGNIDQLSVDILQINDNLADFPNLLEEYVTTLEEIDDQLGQAGEQLNAQLELAKNGVRLLAIWFGLLQIAPLFVGWQMVTGPAAPPEAREDEESQNKEAEPEEKPGNDHRKDEPEGDSETAADDLPTQT